MSVKRSLVLLLVISPMLSSFSNAEESLGFHLDKTIAALENQLATDAEPFPYTTETTELISSFPSYEAMANSFRQPQSYIQQTLDGLKELREHIDSSGDNLWSVPPKQVEQRLADQIIAGLFFYKAVQISQADLNLQVTHLSESTLSLLLQRCLYRLMQRKAVKIDVITHLPTYGDGEGFSGNGGGAYIDPKKVAVKNAYEDLVKKMGRPNALIVTMTEEVATRSDQEATKFLQTASSQTSWPSNRDAFIEALWEAGTRTWRLMSLFDYAWKGPIRSSLQDSGNGF